MFALEQETDSRLAVAGTATFGDVACFSVTSPCRRPLNVLLETLDGHHTLKHALPWIAALFTAPGVWANAAPRQQAAHPAVARVIVSERGGTSYGSGTLVGTSPTHGLVVTNWHVVRDAAGPIMVVFPDGFRSAASVMKIDRDWDLAALAIWRPNVEPVTLATAAPRPGETLTIAGYGPGWFRAVSGRCTQYVAPGSNMPFEMVELAAHARSGDSGGPILNRRGELAGVLFGAASGHTTGSYCGRVRWFLAPLRDEFERLQPAPFRQSDAEMIAQRTQPQQQPAGRAMITAIRARPIEEPAALPEIAEVPSYPTTEPTVVANTPTANTPIATAQPAGPTRAEQIKTILAALGILAVLFHGVRLIGTAGRV